MRLEDVGVGEWGVGGGGGGWGGGGGGGGSESPWRLRCLESLGLVVSLAR